MYFKYLIVILISCFNFNISLADEVVKDSVGNEILKDGNFKGKMEFFQDGPVECVLFLSNWSEGGAIDCSLTGDEANLERTAKSIETKMGKKWNPIVVNKTVINKTKVCYSFNQYKTGGVSCIFL